MSVSRGGHGLAVGAEPPVFLCSDSSIGLVECVASFSAAENTDNRPLYLVKISIFLRVDDFEDF